MVKKTAKKKASKKKVVKKTAKKKVANKNSNLNFEADSKPVGNLSPLIELVDHALALATQIEKGEKLLKELKEQLDRVLSGDLPDKMKELGQSSFMTLDKREVTLKNIVVANIPSESAIRDAKKKGDDELVGELEDRRTKGFQYLRKHGGAPLIKNVIKIDVEKGKDAVARKIVTAAKKEGLEPERITSVHPQSLNSFIKEKLANEKTVADVPFEVFKIFSGDVAKIGKPK